MKIRIAYDAMVLVSQYRQSDSKSGIVRETEEIMHELGRMDDLDLTLVCICGESSSAFGSLHFQSYIRNGLRNEEKDYKYADVFSSKLGVRSIYEKFYNFDILSQNFHRLNPSTSIKSISGRVVFKFAREAIKLFGLFDYRPVLECKDFDIYHSTYNKLPSKEVTKTIPRVLTVQDLIPVIAPELVSPNLTKDFQNTLNSIDLKNDWVICISEYTRKQFCEYTGMSIDRTFVTPLAAASHFYPVSDLDRIAIDRQHYGIPKGNYFLSLASYLAPHKNLDRLIRCFFKLISDRPDLDINLVLAGSKRYKPGESMSHPDFPDLNSRVIYTGYIADEDLSSIYSGATAFIFPSLFEGFGLPTLEAMQCGTPVITSNTTSLPEVVGDAGITIDPLDEDALCQAMLNLLTDSNLVRELKQKGFERSKKFSWAKCTVDTVEVYKKILSSY